MGRLRSSPYRQIHLACRGGLGHLVPPVGIACHIGIRPHLKHLGSPLAGPQLKVFRLVYEKLFAVTDAAVHVCPLPCQCFGEVFEFLYIEGLEVVRINFLETCLDVQIYHGCLSLHAPFGCDHDHAVCGP
ncbi:hypothetical protein SDC9_93310 [bioreactor metagenome]|uniref:Uncharacterized protein n=1 Tax=bioreactor metagenome TaxID=1076179 RepID=A0A645A067_9ZZZZ